MYTTQGPSEFAGARRTVGITYDLRDDYRRMGYTEEETVEFDSLATVDAIDDALTRIGYQTVRIGNIRSLTANLAAGTRWDLVFNIAEGLNGLAREAQVPSLLDAFAIPYTFSDGLTLSLSLHKGLTKRVVRDLGLPTPDFFVVHDERDLAAVNLRWPVFAKPIAGGTSMGISSSSKISTRDALANVCRDLWRRFDQPVLVEEFLPGREFTVGIIGTGADATALGVMEVVLLGNAEPDAYSYANKAAYSSLVKYELVRGELAAEARRVAVRVWQEFGCRDAGRVDLRCDESGTINFLEVNPLAGLHPVDSDLIILCRMVGIEYAELMRAIMTSAEKRVVGLNACSAPDRRKGPGAGL